MGLLEEGYRLFLSSPSFAGAVGGTLFWWGCLYLSWHLRQNGSLHKQGYLWVTAGWALLSTTMLSFFFLSGWEEIEAWQQLYNGAMPSWGAVLGLVSFGAGALSSLLMLPILLGGMGALWTLQLTHSLQVGKAVGLILGLAGIIGILMLVGSRQLFGFSLLTTTLLLVGSQQVRQQAARKQTL